MDEIGTFIRGLTYASENIVNNKGTKVIRANNIVDGDYLNTCSSIITVNKSVSEFKWLKQGDIAICMANGSVNLVGKSSLYDGNEEGPITVGAFCGIYRSDYKLIKWLFQTKKYKRYVQKAVQGGNGAIANFSGSDILNMDFFIPKKSQEFKYYHLLSAIDERVHISIRNDIRFEQLKTSLIDSLFI